MARYNWLNRKPKMRRWIEIQHQKDIPRRYWKYVEWAVVDAAGEVTSAFWSQRWWAKAQLDMDRGHGYKDWSVKPFLRIPLSLLTSLEETYKGKPVKRLRVHSSNFEKD